MNKKKQKVLVGISGGVDSAMSVLALKKNGFEVMGVHFLLSKKEEGENIEELGKDLGIEIIRKDISEAFQKRVVDEFVQGYQRGSTPNPCVICNPEVKFDELIKLADEMGIEKVATGHYACVSEKKGTFSLEKGRDETKDQSYFLHRLSQDQLGRIVFPLCESTKDEIKKSAKKEGVSVEEKESQDVCFFLKDESLASFLKQHIPEKTGKVLDEDGNELGEHKGSFFFTTGQRHGLDLNGGPHFVIGKDTEKNIVFVSKDKNHPKLCSKKVLIENVNWISGEPTENEEYSCRTRYLNKGISCQLQKESDEQWLVKLKQSAWAVTPGQSLVVFDGDEVVGGGIIKEGKQ